MRYTLYLGGEAIIHIADTSALVSFAAWLKSIGKQHTWADIFVDDHEAHQGVPLETIIRQLS